LTRGKSFWLRHEVATVRAGVGSGGASGSFAPGPSARSERGIRVIPSTLSAVGPA